MATTEAVRAEDVRRVAHTAIFAQWGVASVVMVGSAASAGIAFDTLQEHWSIGVVTGLGVDLALASALIIGKRLREVGITTLWGTVLLWLTGGMTLCLNSGAAAATGHWILAVAHAFLPVLLVVLCEFGSEAQLKLYRLEAQTSAQEQSDQAQRLVSEHQRREAQTRAAVERSRADELERLRHEEEVAAMRARITAAAKPAVEPAVVVAPQGGRKPQSKAAKGRGRRQTLDVAVLARHARLILAKEELGTRELASRLSAQLGAEVNRYWAQKAKDRIAEEDAARPALTVAR